MAKDVKVPAAFGLDGTRYEPEDIDDSYKGPIIAAETLFDVNFDSIEPVRKYQREDGVSVKSHFRNAGDSPAGAIGRGEKDKTHDETIALILRQLTKAGTDVAFTTSHPTNKIEVNKKGGGTIHISDEIEIWRCPKGARYEWRSEPETRWWIDSEHYIQPDMMGYDASRRSAGPKNRGVIIEVIHHHPPEPSTWDHLVALSKANHLVMFFFCSPKKPSGSFYGRLDYPNAEKGLPLRIRAAHYLWNGVLHRDGKVLWLDPRHTHEQQYEAILQEFDRAKAYLAK